VSFLTEALVEMGHQVTLFASGDSVTQADLKSVTTEALRLSKSKDPYAVHTLQLQQVVEMAGQFDIIHFHTDYFHFPVSRMSGYCHLTTLHGRLDLPELYPLYQKFQDMPLVSISNSQRKPVPFANFMGTVYHGLPKELFSQGDGSGGYAVMIGRFSPEKGPDKAIEIARRAGLQLKIAAKVDPNDEEYFHSQIKHLLEQPHVEYLGEVNETQKQDLMGNASVFLFPIDWPEPFGMVMIEALACGTPVVAFGKGSVPEIISPGKTGFIVNDVDEAVQAVRNIHLIDRSVCRAEFLERFESRIMARQYIGLYEQMIQQSESIRLPFYRSTNDKNQFDKILSA
jgi:hypothetical protein